MKRKIFASKTKAHVLLYHRVAELPCDPQLLCVSREHFAEHLEVLQKDYQLIQLSQLVKALELKKGNLPPRSIVVTFDDGYTDNLYAAKPLLEQYNIPATLFVATGYIGQEREFWWDELERIFLQPARLPEELVLNLNGRAYHWNLGPAADYSQGDYERYRGWHVLENDEPSMRQTIYRRLCQLIRPLAREERQQVLKDLLFWAQVKTSARLSHRILSSDELLRLVEGGLIEIGTHTVTHPVLAALTEDIQSLEIYNSKTYLEGILSQKVNGFAYPYGAASDYTQETKDIVQAAGFSYACANSLGCVQPGADHFQLPRALVRNWAGDSFARWLEKMFEK